MKKHIYALSLWLSIGMLGGCASSRHLEPLSSGTLYQCNHQTQMNLAMGQNAEYVALYLNGRDILLKRTYMKGEPALIYTNGIYTLYHNGKSGEDALAALEREHVPYLSECKMRHS